MTESRRSKKDSPGAMVRTLKSLKDELQPAFPLSELGLRRFNEVIQSREASSWTPAHVMTATQLASLTEQWERANLELDQESFRVNNHGFPCMNPLLKIQKDLMVQMINLNKLLGLNAKEQGLTGDRQAKRNLADQDARRIIESISEADDLL